MPAQKAPHRAVTLSSSRKPPRLLRHNSGYVTESHSEALPAVLLQFYKLHSRANNTKCEIRPLLEVTRFIFVRDFEERWLSRPATDVRFQYGIVFWADDALLCQSKEKEANPNLPICSSHHPVRSNVRSHVGLKHCFVLRDFLSIDSGISTSLL